MSQAYDILNPIPNKMLQEDGSITKLDGSVLSSGSPERAEWYEIMNPIPNKTLNPDGSISLLSDVLSGGVTGGGSSILTPSFDKMVDIDYKKEIIVEQWLDEPFNVMTIGGYIYQDKIYDPMSRVSHGLLALGAFQVQVYDDGQGGLEGSAQPPIGVMFMQAEFLNVLNPTEDRLRVQWRMTFPSISLDTTHEWNLKMYYMGADTTITQI